MPEHETLVGICCRAELYQAFFPDADCLLSLQAMSYCKYYTQLQGLSMLCVECQIDVAMDSASTMLDMSTSASLQLQVCQRHRMMHVALL